jgi:hypothetical protein
MSLAGERHFPEPLIRSRKTGIFLKGNVNSARKRELQARLKVISRSRALRGDFALPPRADIERTWLTPVVACNARRIIVCVE